MVIDRSEDSSESSYNTNYHHLNHFPVRNNFRRKSSAHHEYDEIPPLKTSPVSSSSTNNKLNINNNNNNVVDYSGSFRKYEASFYKYSRLSLKI